MIAFFVIRNQLVDKKVIWQKKKQKNNRWLPRKYKRWSSRNRNSFFGGSFTAIEKEKQEELLKVAYEYIKNEKVESIRVSTRPDCIDKETLKRLKNMELKQLN